MTLLTTLYTPTLTPSATGYLPSLEDVAALLHSRLRERGGGVPDTFTSLTEPSAGQVLRIIGQEANLVLIDTGSLDPGVLVCGEADAIIGAVRTIIAKRVAAVIELSYWPDSVVNSGPAAGDYWTQIVDVDQPKVVAAARECRLGDVVPGDEQEAATSPSYQFDVYGGETFADRFVKPMNRRW